MAAASEAMFPPGGEIPPSGLDAGVPDFVAAYVEGVPPTVRRLIHALFWLLELAPLARARGRFSRLAPDARNEFLERWRTSRFFFLRLAFTSLRAILTMGYFAHPPVLRALGLAPLEIETPVLEADLLYPPIGAPCSAIRWTAADLTDPSDGVPLDPHGPLHADYREESP